MLAKVLAGMQAGIKDAYRKLSGTEDLKTQPGPRLVELVDHRITEMAGRYAATYPAAAHPPRSAGQPRKTVVTLTQVIRGSAGDLCPCPAQRQGSIL